MPEPRRTQKQIAERYKGNLGYYKKPSHWRRARRWTSFVAIVGGIAAVIFFDRRAPQTFFNTGPISSAHATFGNDCAQCHEPARPSVQLIGQRFQHGISFTAIDRKCETCHQGHDFHEPNVIENRSCSTCHQEHRGAESMRAGASNNCASCHDNRAIMEASAAKGRQLPPATFHLQRTPATQVVFSLPRPADGFTKTFASFAAGHPEFQHDYEKARDPDVLRFNHQRHLAADIPQVNGRKLDCAFCHQPEPSGHYMKRISFAANCQVCHSLQFDPRNPELTLPHGDPAAVRGFLRGLPSQYEALALRKGLTNPERARVFVQSAMTQLRERVRSGENFEREIFFTSDPYKPTAGDVPAVRASFHGCAFCHEVQRAPNGTPMVTKPILVDRWMPRAEFNHAKHASVSCEKCHAAGTSRETSDVLLPSKASCVVCHSPQGKVASDCIICHRYHRDD